MLTGEARHPADQADGCAALAVNAMLLILTQALRTGSPYVLESALVIAVLGFMSTTAVRRRPGAGKPEAG